MSYDYGRLSGRAFPMCHWIQRFALVIFFGYVQLNMRLSSVFPHYLFVSDGSTQAEVFQALVILTGHTSCGYKMQDADMATNSKDDVRTTLSSH